MSAGQFSRTFYECDNGDICPIRVQPETLTASFNGVANAAVAGPATRDNFIQVNKGRREYGTGARCVTAEWDGAAPTGYDDRGTIKIAVPDPAVFNGITLLSAGVYLGANITVIGKSPENTR